jgi:hypothetical protein
MNLLTLRRRVAANAVVFGLSLWSPCVLASEVPASDGPVLTPMTPGEEQEIRRWFRDQENLIHTLIADCRQTETTEPRDGVPRMDRMPTTRSEVTETYRIVWDRDNDRWRRDVSYEGLASAFVLHEGEMLPTSTVSLCSKDIEVRYSQLPKGKRAVTIDNVPPSGQKPMPLPVGVIFEKAIDNTEGVSCGTSAMDGRPMRIVATQHSSWRTLRYLDPSLRYRPRRIEARMADGRVVNRADYSDYRMVNGVLHPHSIAQTAWDRNGRLREVITWRVESIRLNEVIPDGTFAIEVPGGTLVTMLAGEDAERGGYHSQQPLTITIENALDVPLLIHKQMPRPSLIPKPRVYGEPAARPKKGGTAEVLTSRPATQPAADASAK